MASARVREAEVGDYDELCELFLESDELHAELLPGFFRRPKRNPRTLESIRRILDSPDETILVALDHVGDVVGLVHVLIYDTPPVQLMVPKRRAHIDSLVVRRSSRRKRVGTRLLDAAGSWARDRHAEELLLTVWEGNEEAKRFYADLGFRPVNTVLVRGL
jgi:ribosomal protein S18 acetylase RimI-like enzyme